MDGDGECSSMHEQSFRWPSDQVDRSRSLTRAAALTKKTRPAAPAGLVGQLATRIGHWTGRSGRHLLSYLYNELHPWRRAGQPKRNRNRSHSTAQHVGMYPPKASGDPAPVTGFPVGGPAASSQWSSGLLDCFDDCGLCKQASMHA